MAGECTLATGSRTYLVEGQRHDSEPSAHVLAAVGRGSRRGCWTKLCKPPARETWRLPSVAVVWIPPDDDARFGAGGRSNHFDWPAGGTEEFLGRRAARPDSRRTEAKGGLADPLNVFGAVGRLGPLVWST
jgi:hypothetical protein